MLLHLEFRCLILSIRTLIFLPVELGVSWTQFVLVVVFRLLWLLTDGHRLLPPPVLLSSVYE